jgi:hypothetical protein
VDCVLRAVAVPAGQSKVELEFQDPALARGLVVTLLSLAATAALIGLGLRKGGLARHAPRDGETTS